MAEEIKKEKPAEVPAAQQTRGKIQNLGGNMMFIHDPDKQPTKEGRPFGGVMSDKDAFTKFSSLGREISDPDDLDLHNSVMAYLATKNNVQQPKNVGGRPKGATGHAVSDAERARAYRARKREAKIKAEQEAKKGI